MNVELFSGRTMAWVLRNEVARDVNPAKRLRLRSRRRIDVARDVNPADSTVAHYLTAGPCGHESDLVGDRVYIGGQQVIRSNVPDLQHFWGGRVSDDRIDPSGGSFAGGVDPAHPYDADMNSLMDALAESQRRDSHEDWLRYQLVTAIADRCIAVRSTLAGGIVVSGEATASSEWHGNYRSLDDRQRSSSTRPSACASPFPKFSTHSVTASPPAGSFR